MQAHLRGLNHRLGSNDRLNLRFGFHFRRRLQERRFFMDNRRFNRLHFHGRCRRHDRRFNRTRSNRLLTRLALFLHRLLQAFKINFLALLGTPENKATGTQQDHQQEPPIPRTRFFFGLGLFFSHNFQGRSRLLLHDRLRSRNGRHRSLFHRCGLNNGFNRSHRSGFNRLFLNLRFNLFNHRFRSLYWFHNRSRRRCGLSRLLCNRLFLSNRHRTLGYFLDVQTLLNDFMSRLTINRLNQRCGRSTQLRPRLQLTDISMGERFGIVNSQGDQHLVNRCTRITALVENTQRPRRIPFFNRDGLIQIVTLGFHTFQGRHCFFILDRNASDLLHRLSFRGFNDRLFDRFCHGCRSHSLHHRSRGFHGTRCTQTNVVLANLNLIALVQFKQQREGLFLGRALAGNLQRQGILTHQGHGKPLCALRHRDLKLVVRCLRCQLGQ